MPIVMKDKIKLFRGSHELSNRFMFIGVNYLHGLRKVLL